MAVQIDIEYQGDLHCKAKHAPSGIELITDAPTDNGGRGESFSPTDLVATALGTCLVTIMGQVAKRNQIPIEGTKVQVVKEMIAQPVRRIGSLKVTITVPNAAQIPQEQRQKMERAAHVCPVHQSLHSDIQVPIEFLYVDA